MALWSWLSPLLVHGLGVFHSITQRLWATACTHNTQNIHGFIVIYASMLIVWEIWKARCKARYESHSASIPGIIRSIHSTISLATDKMTFKHCSTVHQIQLLSSFGWTSRASSTATKMVRWIPPIHGFLLNVDGASRGNPGHCGGGGCIRDIRGHLLIAFSHYYGYGSSIVAETRAMCDGIRLAQQHGIQIATINSDSANLVSSFRSGNAPSWTCLRWWREILHFARDSGILISHVYREGNQVADALATYACSVQCNDTYFTSSQLPKTCFGPLVADRLGLFSFRHL